MDIAELEWHVKQEKRNHTNVAGQLLHESELNKKLKENINFNEKQLPFVEEKIRLEKIEMAELRKKQADQTEISQIGVW